MIAPLCSVDGRITPLTDAVVPAADDGLRRGDGVFEVIRLYGGLPFALAAHLDRLGRSARSLRLDCPRQAVEREAHALLAAAGEVDALLRVVLTRAGRRVLAVEPLPSHAEAIPVATVTYAPNLLLDGVKSLSYAANMHATRLARDRGAEEALLVRPDGTVLEGPTSALFWVSAEGSPRTPALDLGLLASITRARVLDALDVEEGAFSVEDLLGCREAFLASTTREVQPISAIDERRLDPVPGPFTEAAQRAFGQARDSELKRDHG